MTKVMTSQRKHHFRPRRLRKTLFSTPFNKPKHAKIPSTMIVSSGEMRRKSSLKLWCPERLQWTMCAVARLRQKKVKQRSTIMGHWRNENAPAERLKARVTRAMMLRLSGSIMVKTMSGMAICQNNELWRFPVRISTVFMPKYEDTKATGT